MSIKNRWSTGNKDSKTSKSFLSRSSVWLSCQISSLPYFGVVNSTTTSETSVHWIELSDFDCLCLLYYVRDASKLAFSFSRTLENPAWPGALAKMKTPGRCPSVIDNRSYIDELCDTLDAPHIQSSFRQSVLNSSCKAHNIKTRLKKSRRSEGWFRKGCYLWVITFCGSIDHCYADVVTANAVGRRRG